MNPVSISNRRCIIIHFFRSFSLSALMLLLISGHIYAQSIGIGTLTPETSAILDLSSTTSGFLLPRMTTTQRNAIQLPVQGLKIFNTDDRCEDTYDGQKWSKNCDVISNNSAAINPGNWIFKSTFPDVSYSPKCFVIGGIIYIIADSDFYSYNPQLNQWIKKSNFPVPRNGGIAFSLNGKGYFGLGYSDKKDLWEYDTSTDIWTQLLDFPGLGRKDAVVFTVNNKAYVGTGYNDSGSLPLIDFWQFDPIASTMWSEVAPLPQSARTNAIAFSINNKGYVGSGWDGNGPMPHYYQTFYEFTPSISGGNGTWISKALIPELWIRSTGVSTNSFGYFGLGGSNQLYNDKFWKYDPVLNFWNPISNFRGGKRQGSFGCAIGNQIYVGLDDYHDDLWTMSEGSITGKEYIENIPNDALEYKGFDWSYDAYNTLRTTRSNVYTYIDGSLAVKEKIVTGDSYAYSISDPLLEVRSRVTTSNLTADPLVKIGESNDGYLSIDGDQIQSQNYSTAKTLKIQPFGGLTSVGGEVTISGATVLNDNLIVSDNQTINGAGTLIPLKIIGGADASLTGNNSGYILIGEATGENIVLDNNEIIARNGGVADNLSLQSGSGNVVIGSGGSIEKLTVYGHAYKSTGSTSWTNSSDRRLKEEISTFQDGLHELLKIDPVWYRYTKESGCDHSQKYVGVIAQELQKIAPYMVSESKKIAPDGSAYLQVDNSAMTYMLINAVKEQQSIIEELKKQNTELKGRIDLFRADINTIKSMVTSQLITKK